MHKDICPICRKRFRYKKKVKINDGYTIVDEYGNYRFKKIGVKEKIDEYWSCEKCTKIFYAHEYNKMLIDYINLGEVFLTPKQELRLRHTK